MKAKNAVVLAMALLFIAFSARPLLADKANDTLNWASDREVESTDAYYNNAREGIVFARLIWDQLLYRNPLTGKYEGLLAKSVRWVSDTEIETDLRQGITFHNGQPFTAEDVVYTLNYVVNPANKVVTKANVNWIKNAEMLGPYKVRINLKQPFPAAFAYLAGPIPIYPHEYYAKVGPQGMNLHPIGTGPYKVTHVDPGKSVTFVKNDNYFKASPKGQPSIGKLFYRSIPDKETQTAELLTGGLDWIWRVDKDQAAKLKQMPNLSVISGESMRIGYIGMRTATDRNSPLKDLRVRRAIEHAINRKSMAVNLVGGGSRVIYSACFPEQFGCTEDVPKYDYDPAKARELLKEAGYPSGFSIDLYAYRERPYAEAMIGYLHDVGIRANLRFLKYSALRDQVRQGKTDMVFMTWGSNSIADASAITGIFFRGTPDDANRDPKVMEWLKRADTSIEPAVRKQNYQKALARIQDQAYWVPLFTYTVNYAFTSDLAFTPTADEIPHFVNAHWK